MRCFRSSWSRSAAARRTLRLRFPFASRIRLLAMCWIVAMFLGLLSVRRRISPSWKTTSITRCRRFSMPWWARAGRGASNGREERKTRRALVVLPPRRTQAPTMATALRPGKRGSGGAAVRVQPGHILTDPRAAGLDARVIGIGGLECGRRGLFRDFEVKRDLFGQAALIVLQRRKIIGPAREDGLGDFRLRPQGVDGDAHTRKARAFPQQGYCTDFIAVRLCRLLPRNQPLARGPS